MKFNHEAYDKVFPRENEKPVNKESAVKEFDEVDEVYEVEDEAEVEENDTRDAGND